MIFFSHLFEPTIGYSHSNHRVIAEFPVVSGSSRLIPNGLSHLQSPELIETSDNLFGITRELFITGVENFCKN